MTQPLCFFPPILAVPQVTSLDLGEDSSKVLEEDSASLVFSSRINVPSSSEQLNGELLMSKCVLLGEDCRFLFSFLNNDFPCSFEFGGRHYTCATSAYEAQKFLSRFDLMQRFTALDAKEAYDLSAEKHLQKNPSWHGRRLEAMSHVLRAKFGQNPDLKDKLLMTQGYLSLHTEHKNMDPFWTDDSDGSGGNRFGALLMQIRSEYGGCGQVAMPTNYRELLPLQESQGAVAGPQKDEDIIAEIRELNSRINEEDYKRHSQIARLPGNLCLTRFPWNNFPYDDTLVQLTSGRFINASFVLDRKFIGTQAPMENTNEDFWSMILEHNVPIVIMLNRIGDPGDDIYFPFALSDKKNYGDIHLELQQAPFFKTDLTWRQSPHEEEPHAIIHREIKIRRGDESPRILHHFQYQNWRDFSAGNERAAAYLVQTVNSIRVDNYGAPTVIHCHAGVGRTGVMITLLDQSLNLSGTLDVKGSIERQRSLNEGRCSSMVQSEDQYCFCYRVLRLLLGKK